MTGSMIMDMVVSMLLWLLIVVGGFSVLIFGSTWATHHSLTDPRGRLGSGADPRPGVDVVGGRVAHRPPPGVLVEKSLAADSLRASDADREYVAALLGEHHVAGRLTAEELDQRLDEAYAARNLGGLRELMKDLP